MNIRLFAGRNAFFLAFAFAMSAGLSQLRAQEVVPEVKHDLSPPLREIHPDPSGLSAPHEARRPGATSNRLGVSGPVETGEVDSTLQSAPIMLGSPTPGITFQGVGAGFTGPSGTFVVNSAPPDPNGTVGPNHYVETVNASFAVFNKSGTPLLGPIAINAIFSGFGGGCQTNNDGDPTVVYDKIADRWVIQQFSVSTTPYLQCVAVSATNDPTGAYHRYSFQFTDFPDYPKLGVWPDAYYLTVNAFSGGVNFNGSRVCALNRTAMLAGNAASLVCFSTSTSFGSLLPSDLDGPTLPPAGAPNYMLALNTNSTLVSWKFHTDFVTPANSTFTGPTSITVAPYASACGGGTCIPQPGTTQQLDSLADRMMYRLAYRNFGTHESLVVNHSVTAGSVPSGVRWYELRIAGGTPTIFQQGTYAPDATSRWMGSIAMDSQGGIALGYSVSSSSTFPGIHYTGRLAGDAAGTMTQGENSIINGAGSQSGNNLSRWGDYSSMSVDPADDCTFWYTNEYLKSTGSFNWSTRIGTFKLPGCGAVTSDFSLAATPASQTVQQGSSTTFTATETPSGGFTGSVTLTVSGLPTGATGTFSPNPTTSSSSLSVATSATTPAGSYPLTITGTSGALVHTANVTLTVTSTSTADFSLTASPGNLSVAQGANGTSTIAVTAIAGFSGSVALSASGLPAGVSALFTPATTTTTSTLRLTASRSAAAGSATVTVTGTSGSLTHTATITLTVTGAATPSYTLSASPSSLSVVQHASGNSTITVTPSNGFTGSVALSASGLPAGVTASFSPATTTTSSTLTLTASSTAAVGAATVTITGTSGTLTKTTTVSLTVTAAAVPNYTLSASPNSLSIAQSAGGSSTVTVTATGGFTGSVALSASGLPAGVTASFSPASTTSSSVLTLTASSTATVGAATVTITGTSGTLTKTTTVSLTVTASAVPNYTLSASPNSLSIAQTSGGSSTISVAATGGFTGSVALSASGLPTGVTASFSPASTTSSSVLTLTASSTATVGPATVTITGTSGTLTKTTTIALTVTSGTVGLQLIGNPGFETGTAAPWNMSAGTLCTAALCGGESAHSGSWFARLGGTGTTHTDTIKQKITIPAGNTVATLNFFMHIDTAETTTTRMNDKVVVYLTNSMGAVVATLGTYSNLNAAAGYAQHTFDVSGLIGQTVSIVFVGTETGALATSFVVDDVTLTVQ